MQALVDIGLVDRIRTLWQQTLGLASGQVLPDSHFLLLGGDSLQLARLLARVQAELGVSLPQHELARYATPARMAACCSHAVPERGPYQVPALREAQALPAAQPLHDALAAQLEQLQSSAEAGLSVPATPVQQGIWLAEQLAAPRLLYLSSLLLHLSGPLDLRALQQACRALLQRHPVLRSRLCHDVATRRLHLCLRSAALPADAAVPALHICNEDELAAQVTAAVEAPLQLEQGPLCRMQLFRLAPQQHALLLSCHHVISDGWSGGILLEQLAQDYNAARLQRALAPDPPDLRFFAYCRRLHAGAAADTALRLQWWQQQLAALDACQDWLWQGLAAEPWPHAVQSLQLELPATLMTALQRRAQDLRQSLFILFLYAVKAGLYACSGQTRQLLLLPVAQRRPDEEASIGCFVEPLLLPGRWQPALALEQALQHEAGCFAQLRQQQLPLATLAAQLRPRLLPDGNPWSSILFAYQSFPQTAPHWEGLQQRVQALPEAASQYALKLEVLPGAAAWTLRIEYATAVLGTARAAALGAQILQQLQGLPLG